jgi:hypothetical protein
MSMNGTVDEHARSMILTEARANDDRHAVIMRELSDIRRDITSIKTAVQATLVRLVGEQRDRTPSAHDIAVEVAEEITSPGIARGMTNSDRVRTVVRTEIEIAEGKQLKAEREKSSAWMIAIVSAVIAGASGIYELVHALVGKP